MGAWVRSPALGLNLGRSACLASAGAPALGLPGRAAGRAPRPSEAGRVIGECGLPLAATRSMGRGALRGAGAAADSSTNSLKRAALLELG